MFLGKTSSNEAFLIAESPPSQATTNSSELPGGSVIVTATMSSRSMDDEVSLS